MSSQPPISPSKPEGDFYVLKYKSDVEMVRSIFAKNAKVERHVRKNIQ